MNRRDLKKQTRPRVTFSDLYVPAVADLKGYNVIFNTFQADKVCKHTLLPTLQLFCDE